MPVIVCQSLLCVSCANDPKIKRAVAFALNLMTLVNSPLPSARGSPLGNGSRGYIGLCPTMITAQNGFAFHNYAQTIQAFIRGRCNPMVGMWRDHLALTHKLTALRWTTPMRPLTLDQLPTEILRVRFKHLTFRVVEPAFSVPTSSH